MPSRAYDVAIIGGGHNGLVCAAYLARAGNSVVVLEKNRQIGGAAMTEEFHPGFRNSVAAYTVSLLHPEIIEGLDLHEHGLKIIERPAANFWPLDDARYLLVGNGPAARAEAIAQLSARDGEIYPSFDAALGKVAGLLRDHLLKAPPVAGAGILDLIRSAPLAHRFAKLPIEDQRLIVDLFSKSVSDFLDQWFENDTVKAALAFDGIVGTYASPSTPGTAYVLLHHSLGETNGMAGVWGHAVGGMGAISNAVLKAALLAGAVVRTEAPVSEVLVEDQRAIGVRLASGEVIRTRIVAANVGPKLLFRDLVPADAVAPGLRSRFTGIKTGSGSFRMNVALSSLPNFTCLPTAQSGYAGTHHGAGIVIGPTLDYLERAYLDARINGWSTHPVVEMVISSALDSSLAPPNQHVASLFVQHVAPRLPAPRSWEDEREKAAFAQVVIDTVTRYAPNFRQSVLACQALSPLDLERRFGMIDGDISHGQMSLDQLFAMRPVLGHSDYRMPVKGLYLCGAGAHPGGGVSGLPGHNAAQEMIRDLKRDPPWLRG